MKTITIIQAYLAMLRCFHHLYLKTEDVELSMMMSGAALYALNPGKEPETMDPADWHDWMRAVKMVVQDDAITFDSCKLTAEQAYEAVGRYFKNYCDRGCEESVALVSDLLNERSENSDLALWLRIQWDQALQQILQEAFPEKIGHFFTEETTLNLRESYMIMQLFLASWCKKTNNDLVITMIQLSRLKNSSDYWHADLSVLDQRIMILWQQALEKVQMLDDTQTVTVLTAYKAMPIFLNKYFKDTIDKEIQALINDCTLQGDNFIENTLGNDWLWAVGKLNDEQEARVYSVVTLHTPVKKDQIASIIKTWLQKFFNENVLTAYAHFLADQTVVETIFENIKKQHSSYLLPDDAMFVLDTYYYMLAIIQVLHQPIDLFAINKDGKPQSFMLLLQWLHCCEQVIIKH